VKGDGEVRDRGAEEAKRTVMGVSYGATQDAAEPRQLGRSEKALQKRDGLRQRRGGIEKSVSRGYKDRKSTTI